MRFNTVSNWISIGRMFLGVVVCGLLVYSPVACSAWTLAGLTWLAIWLDGLDGYVARKLGEASVLGSVVDILSDRALEQVYWLTFWGLGWVSWWVPLVFILRGVWVDGLRGLLLQKGYTAFGSTTLMRHWLGVLLVSSRFSRWTYAVCKALAFGVVILAYWPEGQPERQWVALQPLAQAMVWASTVFCLVRGLPVLWQVAQYKDL